MKSPTTPNPKRQLPGQSREEGMGTSTPEARHQSPVSSEDSNKTDLLHLGSGHGRRDVCSIGWEEKNQGTSSRRTSGYSESEDSEGGHWKSKSKRHRSDTYEDDLSQPWTCEERNPFTTRIRHFDFPRTRMPSHVKTYDGSGDPEDHIKLFQSVAKTERWAMPTWCHMFNSTLTRNATVWNDKPRHPEWGNTRKVKTTSHPDDPHGKELAKQNLPRVFFRRTNISFPPLGDEDGTEGPMIIEAEIGGHFVHRMYVDGGASLEILYEHCFVRLRPEIRSQMVPPTTYLTGFSGETIWPLGQISLLVKIGDEEHSTSAWMNFMVVRSPSQHNGIIGRPGIRKIRAIPSTAHGMLKFPVEGGTVTLRSSRIIPMEKVNELQTQAHGPPDLAKY
ncbi:reverse transcriptase domain-containing protein [Tanacetum coccineum]